MRALVLLLAGALLCAGGCKKSPSYDRSSPENTLESFFAALDAGRIPEDLGLFLADDTEHGSWKLRCRQGCASGDLTILETADASGHSATIVANYKVYSRDNVRLMQGKQSPIRFQRDGDIWRIAQFGRRIVITPKTQTTRDAGVEDASAATDGSSPSDAAPH